MITWQSVFPFSVIGITKGFSRDDVEQHLDDFIRVGSLEEDGPVDHFFQNYLEETDKAGVKIDSSGNRRRSKPHTQW